MLFCSSMRALHWSYDSHIEFLLFAYRRSSLLNTIQNPAWHLKNHNHLPRWGGLRRTQTVQDFLTLLESIRLATGILGSSGNQQAQRGCVLLRDTWGTTVRLPEVFRSSQVTGLEPLIRDTFYSIAVDARRNYGAKFFSLHFTTVFQAGGQMNCRCPKQFTKGLLSENYAN